MSDDTRKDDKAADDEATDDTATDETATAENRSGQDDGTDETPARATGAAAAAAGGDDAEPGPAAGDGAAEATAPRAAARPSRLPLLTAGLALLVALAALGGLALLWLSDRGPDELSVTNEAAIERLAGTLEELEPLEDRVDDNAEALADLRDARNEAEQAIDALSRQLTQRLRPLEALPGRLSGIESQIAALQGVAGGLRDTWLLAEAEYYLQIANAQLTLANNVDVARTALELADERLASLGDSSLVTVRQQVSDELRALDAVDTVDIESAALTLSSLTDATRSLPLRTDVVRPDFDDPAVSDDLSGPARAWAALRNSLSNVISVRRSDRPVKPLLPPDAAYFLRSNLALQLQAARLALLRGEEELFRQSLDDARRWIDEYYDPDSTPVQSALDTIDELRELQVTATLPDISRSLELLRQQVALQRRERLRDGGSEGSNGPGQ